MSDGRAVTPAHIFVALGVCAFSSQVAYRIADPLVPLVAGSFDVSIATAATLATAYALPYGLVQLLLGPLGDSFGKANVIRIAIALLAGGLLLSAVALTFPMLLGARILSGMAAGGIIPAAIAVVGDRVPIADRQVMLARLMTMNYLGMLTGPAISGVVGAMTGWRAVFGVTAVLVGGGAVYAYFRLTPRQNVVRPPLSFASARGNYASVFAKPMVWPFLGLVMLEGIGCFAILPFVADIIASRSTAGVFEAGIVIAFFGIGGILFTFLARRLVPLLGMRRQMQAGGVTAAAALVCFAFSAWWQLDAIAFLVFGFGFLMLHITLQTIATELTSDARGSALAVFALVFFIGQATGPILYGALRPHLGDTVTVLAAGLALATVGLAVSYLLADPRRQR